MEISNVSYQASQLSEITDQPSNAYKSNFAERYYRN